MTHTQALANTDASLPPILVHRQSMRVIDGMHRLRAAQLCGRREIDVRFFDGSKDDAFILAVEANVIHGLPLSPADREAAATRIVTSHPELSDRAIAASAGLAARTVAAIRSRTTGKSSQLNDRIGRDGRVRPLDATVGRRRAYEVIQARPSATLREIAKEAGVAVGTARDVRARVQRGENPLPAKLRDASEPDASKSESGVSPPPQSAPMASLASTRDPEVLLQSLMKDPSLRLSERGRTLLRWLSAHLVSPAAWDSVFEAVPPHCADLVADLAMRCADMWRDAADEMTRRAAHVS